MTWTLRFTFVAVQADQLMKSMTANANILPWMLPEVLLLTGILALLTLSLFRQLSILQKQRLVVLTAILSLGSSVTSLFLVPDQAVDLAGDMFQISPFAAGIRSLTGWALFMSILLVRAKESLGSRLTEKLLLMLSMGLGLNLLCLSSHFLTSYLGLELASIAAWALTTINGNVSSQRAALKYFVFGSVASALMLYGMSWLYGISGSMTITSAAFKSAVLAADPVVVTVAFALVTTGILFKISAIPFHFWAPDVYASAPVSVVAFFSTAPKIASLGFLWHLTYAFAPVGPSFIWLCLIAGVTLTVGNLAALGQTSFRRLMAWSSIGQSGFLISALLSGTAIGRDAALMYALFYTIGNVAVFELIRIAEKQLGDKADYLLALTGLGLKSRGAFLWGITAVVALLSLVGLPPTAGFTAKFMVFTALLEEYNKQGSGWLLSVLLLGLLNTVLALFYYLKVPYYLFVSQPNQPEILTQEQGFSQLKTNVMVVTLCFLLLVGFLKTDWLLYALQLQIRD